MTSSLIFWCYSITHGSSAYTQGTSLFWVWLSNKVTVSGSSRSGTWLIISVTLLSASFRYSMVMSYPAIMATHQCPIASKLGVVITYVSRLLSVLMVNGLYQRYSLNWLVMAHEPGSPALINGISFLLLSTSS